MVSTCHLIFKSANPLVNPLVTVPRAPIIIGTTVTLMFHSFSNFLARSKYLSFFSLSYNFILWSAGTPMSTIWHVFFFFCWLLQGLVVWPRLNDPFVSQNPRGVCASHSPEQMLGCAYTICWYCQNSISCTISWGWCLVLGSFCTNLMHSLIMWNVSFTLFLLFIDNLFWDEVKVQNYMNDYKISRHFEVLAPKSWNKS